jgi:3-hydroxybutyryl-CoA dehydrogenase
MAAELNIAVIGAGLMGHGLAQVFAEAGWAVRLHDPNAEVLSSATTRIASNLQTLGRDTRAAKRVELHAKCATAVAGADFVFEAAPERLEIKQAIFAQLEQLAPETAVLATNTSVMPVGQIGAGVKSAGRVLGTHWWNPPYLIPLVEVVQAERTAPEVVERTLALLLEAGKQPVHVKRDVPGFVGNRLQHALWREAIAIVADGVCDAKTVDDVVKTSFGPRLTVMGPIETADYIGLDLTLDIHQQILHDLNCTPAPSPFLCELVARGHLGMKTGQGFRSWEPGDSERMRADLLRHLNAHQNEVT